MSCGTEVSMKTLLFAFVLLAASNTMAALLVVNSDGKLTGAQNVDVGGVLYDMEFVVGTGNDVFWNSATNNYDLDATPDNGELFANAILDQVWVGIYDNQPELTFGCQYSWGCDVETPMAVFDDWGSNVFSVIRANNFEGGGGFVDLTTNATEGFTSLWVDWTLAGSTPVDPDDGNDGVGVNEPTSYLLFLLAFVGRWFRLRYKKS